MRKIIFLEGTQPDLHKLFKKAPNTNYAEASTLQNNLDTIKKDLPRQSFADPVRDFKSIRDHWENAAKNPNYSYLQGDMTGELLPALIQTHYILMPLHDNNNDLFFNLSDNRRALCFGYFNNDGVAAGFSIRYFKNKPSQWIISFLHNGSASYDQRRCQLFIYNLDNKIDKEISNNQSNRCKLETLLSASNSYAISDLLHYCINPNNTLNIDFLQHAHNKTLTGQTIKPAEIIASYFPAEKIITSYAKARKDMLNNTGLTDKKYSANMLTHYSDVLACASDSISGKQLIEQKKAEAAAKATLEKTETESKSEKAKEDPVKPDKPTVAAMTR